MAIEDAAILAALFGGVASWKRGAVERVFEVFDRRRKERTQKLVTTSREAGLLYDFELDGVGDDVERIRAFMAHRMQWIWDFEANESAKMGLEMLQKVL
ncbi:uncharacterized protein HMPREF1541_00646 [Cyphellophora europaea CBS 101466]|uniref:Uncharacterized protein n=1 Tax=Cyphellophora europaea (strain CBS 101466) TaxID=1220924 RepID=W2SCM0_CYPE1|nr:uncharacterized protein HMPREF1541_00646 [Cyphellophora europaea CBS 101466]ETN46461.1 hypothetical protein HMPREF1541_00646 [Cyphellophora europaea CBS 101466]